MRAMRHHNPCNNVQLERLFMPLASKNNQSSSLAMPKSNPGIAVLPCLYTSVVPLELADVELGEVGRTVARTESQSREHSLDTNAASHSHSLLDRRDHSQLRRDKCAAGEVVCGAADTEDAGGADEGQP